MTTVARPELRDYQHHANDAIWSTFQKGQNRILMQMATGLGKTVTFAAFRHHPAVVAWLAQFPPQDRKMLIIAHREELLAQAIDKIARANPDLYVALEQGEAVSGPFADVVVASVQTLAARNYTRLEKLLKRGTFRIVIVDEAHHAAAGTYRNSLVRLGFLPPEEAGADEEETVDAATLAGILRDWETTAPRDRLLIGCTATPNRTDSVGLGCVFQTIAYTYPIKKAIDDGWLAPITPWVIDTTTSLDGVAVRRGEFDTKQLSDAVNTDARNQLAIAAWHDKAPGRSTIAFTVDVAHAHAVADAFRRAGVAAEAVSGETPKDYRRQILAGYTAGKIQVIANCFDYDTEILTHERGWVGGNDVGEGDYIAAVGIQTGHLTWEPVLEMVRRERLLDERMVRIDNQTLDLRVTEGHRLLWRTHGAQEWKITEAHALPDKKASYEFRIAAHGFFEGVPLSDIELEFLGLFATDGSLNRERASIEIAQSVASPMCAEIERILTACGFDWKSHDHDGRTPAGEVRRYRRYRVPKGNIGGQLARRGWVGIEPWLDKSLSPMLAVCTAKQFRHLLHGLWIGDGYKTHAADRPNSGVEVCCADPVLTDRVQAWAVTRGMGCSVSWYDNGPMATKPIAVIRVRERDTICTNNASVPTSGGNPSTFEAPGDRESVWCVTNATGTVIVRRQGRVMVTGQCMILTEGTDLPRTSCILHLKPTKSATLYEQMTGRGLRRHDGKQDCVVIDLADLTRRHSLQTAPVLYGLPPLKPEGKNLTEIASELDALREAYPSFDLDAALSQGSLTLAQLRAKAVAVDIWAIPDLGPIGASLAYLWIKISDGLYRLQYPWADGYEVIKVERNMLGRYDIVSTLRPTPPPGQRHITNGVRQQTITADVDGVEAALRLAEAFISQARHSASRLLDKGAFWRKVPATPNQIKFLKIRKIPFRSGVTKGEASQLLDLANARRGR